MGILGDIAALAQLGKGVPDSVGYEDYGRVNSYYPEEVFNHLQATNFLINKKYFSTYCVEIYNDSSSVQKDLKILFNGNFSLKPKLKFVRRDIEVSYEVDEKNKEIRITEIPPKESVNIVINEPDNKFKIYQVLIGDNQITPLRNKYFKLKNLLLTRQFILPLIVTLCLGVSLLYLEFKASSQRELKNAMDQKVELYLESIGFKKCGMVLLKNNNESKLALKVKFNKLDDNLQKQVLMFNQTDNIEDLLQKESIYWCNTSNNENEGSVKLFM